MPIRLPAVAASFQGTPNSHTTGANSQPKMRSSDSGAPHDPGQLLEDRIGQRDQRHHHDQHGEDLEIDLQPVLGAARDRVHAGAVFVIGFRLRCRVTRLARHHDARDQDRRRQRHHRRDEDMARARRARTCFRIVGVEREHRAGDRGEADGHQDEQLAAGELARDRAGSAAAPRPCRGISSPPTPRPTAPPMSSVRKHERHRADDDRQDAPVPEQRRQRRDHDHQRQDAEREVASTWRGLVTREGRCPPPMKPNTKPVPALVAVVSASTAPLSPNSALRATGTFSRSSASAACSSHADDRRCARERRGGSPTAAHARARMTQIPNADCRCGKKAIRCNVSPGSRRSPYGKSADGKRLADRHGHARTRCAGRQNRATGQGRSLEFDRDHRGHAGRGEHRPARAAQHLELSVRDRRRSAFYVFVFRDSLLYSDAVLQVFFFAFRFTAGGSGITRATMTGWSKVELMSAQSRLICGPRSSCDHGDGRRLVSRALYQRRPHHGWTRTRRR